MIHFHLYILVKQISNQTITEEEFPNVRWGELYSKTVQIPER